MKIPIPKQTYADVHTPPQTFTPAQIQRYREIKQQYILDELSAHGFTNIVDLNALFWTADTPTGASVKKVKTQHHVIDADSQCVLARLYVSQAEPHTSWVRVCQKRTSRTR